MGQKHLASGCHESSSNRRDRARYVPPVGRAGLPAALVKPIMNRPAAPAEKNAGMLDGFVGVQQARPDRTNLGPIEQSSQNVVPPLGQHHHVVIGEDDQRRIDLVNRAIVEVRPTERLIEGQHPSYAPRREFDENVARLRLAATIVNDQ